MTIGDIKNGDWQSKITGPWVFVFLSGTVSHPIFKFFILSPSEMIKMVEVTHDWYINQWTREKPLSNNGVACINLKWLEKEDEIAKNNIHPECIIPLDKSSEDRWEKLWED